MRTYTREKPMENFCKGSFPELTSRGWGCVPGIRWVIRPQTPVIPHRQLLDLLVQCLTVLNRLLCVARLHHSLRAERAFVRVLKHHRLCIWSSG